jgi:hypothetical protein
VSTDCNGSDDCNDASGAQGSCIHDKDGDLNCAGTAIYGSCFDTSSDPGGCPVDEGYQTYPLWSCSGFTGI